MATTSWTAIRDGYVTAITSLTPSNVSNPKYTERPIRHADLREWATTNPGSGALRRFQLLRTDGGEEAPYMDPSQVEMFESMELVVAYPTQPTNLYGGEGNDSIEDIIEDDATQLRDTITSAGNYQSGQNLAKVTAVTVEKDNEDVWFSVISFQIRYYKAQSLT